MTHALRLRTAALAAVICGLFLQSAAGQSTPPTPLYTIGNSFSDHVIGISNISASLGRPVDFGRHMIPGAPLGFIWANPASGISTQGFYPEAIPAKAWQVITLQPWDENLAAATAAAGNFTQFIGQNCPGARIFVLATSSFSLLPNTPPGAFHAAFVSANSTNRGSRAFFHGLVDAVRAAHPARAVGLVPIQHVIAELDRRLGLGQSVPEVATVADLLDSTNHFNARGRYLATLTLFSTMFRVPPTGAMRENFASGYSVSQAFAEYAWQLVWDVVSAEAYSVPNLPGGADPVAAFSVTPARGAAPLTVTFNAGASSDPDGTIVSYHWDFGGNQTATGPVVTRTFDAGVHRARLLVTDNEGRTGQAFRFVQAGAAAPQFLALEAEWAEVGANWNIPATPDASMGEAVMIKPGFNSTASPPADTAANRVRFRVNIPSAANYWIWARVSAPTDSDDSFWVRVNGGAWFAWNNIGNRTLAYTWVRMPNSYSLAAGNATIDFLYREDGTGLDKIQLTTNASATPLAYGLPGINREYDDEPPTAPVGLAATNLRVNGFTLGWNASSDNEGVAGYEVFRDGTPLATVAGLSHEVQGMAPASTANFTVRAFDAEGNRSPQSAPLAVTTPPNHPPAAVIGATALAGIAPLTVTFSGGNSTDTDPGDIVIGYSWDFGSGPEGDSVNQITRTFTAPGNYTVTLTVVDLFGAQSSASVVVRVAEAGPRAQWRQEQFGTPFNEGEAADSADPDGDGLNNFLEYALGRHPRQSDTTPPLEIDIANRKLRFLRARAELDYIVERSEDLVTWTSYANNPGTHENLVEVALPPPAQREFYRLRIVAP